MDSAELLPTEDDVGRALHWLAETDQPLAEARAVQRAAELRIKIVEADEYLMADGPAAERQASARSSSAYSGACEDFKCAVASRELLELRRERAKLVIDVWRSLNASRRIS